MSNHVFVTSLHTNVAGQAVHALVVAGVLQLLLAGAVQAWEAVLLAHTIVTGVVADSLSNVLHELLFSNTVTLKAVGASLTTLLPLTLITGHWVIKASSTVGMTPTIVAFFFTGITFLSFSSFKDRVCGLLVQECGGIQCNNGHCKNQKCFHCCCCC